MALLGSSGVERCLRCQEDPKRIKRHKIRERAADVDTDAQTAHADRWDASVGCASGSGEYS